MAAPIAPTPTPTPSHDPSAAPGAPRPPMATGRLAALAAVAVVAAAVGTWAPVRSDLEDVRELVTTTAYVVALAAALPVAVSLLNRRAARHGRYDHTVTFTRPAGPDIARPERSVRPLVAISVVAAVAFGAAYLLDAASRNLTEAFCSDSVDPDTCANDAGFPLAVLGALCALVVVGCTGTAAVVLVRRRLARRRARVVPPL